MRPGLASTLLTVGLTGLGLPTLGRSATFEQEDAPKPIGVRVIYLREMGLREAMTLVRSKAQVPRAAALEDRDAIIVGGAAATLERCETVLREHDAVLRVAEPHAPVESGRYAPDTLVPRVFRVSDDRLQDAVVVLRAIYSIRELSDYPPDSTLSVEAPQSVLDAAEALLRELELLAPASQSDDEP